MQTFILILNMINQLFPLAIQTVKAVESVLPAKDQGTAKMALVRATLEGAFAHYAEAKVAFDQVWVIIQPMISIAVAAFNASGEFKKTTPTS